MDTHVFKILGSRNQQHGHFVLAPQNWQGTIPDNSQLLTLEHNSSWLLARYLVKGPQDLPNLYAIKDEMGLQTLSEFIARTENKTLSD